MGLPALGTQIPRLADRRISPALLAGEGEQDAADHTLAKGQARALVDMVADAVVRVLAVEADALGPVADVE